MAVRPHEAEAPFVKFPKLLMDGLLASPMPAVHKMVVLAVLRKTIGHRQGTRRNDAAPVSLSLLAIMTGHHRNSVRRARADLVRENVIIEMAPATVCAAAVVYVNPDPLKWRAYAPQPAVLCRGGGGTTTVPGTTVVPGTTRVPQGVPPRCIAGTTGVPQGVPPRYPLKNGITEEGALPDAAFSGASTGSGFEDLEELTFTPETLPKYRERTEQIFARQRSGAAGSDEGPGVGQ